MFRHYYFRIHGGCALHDDIEIIDFEPHKNAVSVGLPKRVSNRTVMVIDAKLM